MRVTSVLALGSIAVFAACSDSGAPTQSRDPVSPAMSASESGDDMNFDASKSSVLKIFPTVAAQRAQNNPSNQAALPILYHSPGRVIPSPKVAAIYWSSGVIYNGGPTPGTAGLGSADGSVVGAFMRTMGGTPFWSINNEYTDASGFRVLNSLAYTRFYANNVSAPGSGANVSDATIRSMLSSVVGSTNMPFNQQTIYAVFSGTGVNLGGGFGTQYCAYHSFFARPGHPGQYIIYSVQPRDADFVGACTTINTPATNSPNNDFSADATINVLSHELEEASTDPGLNAWFDAAGQENADKCAWTFGTTFTVANGSQANVTFSGKNYLIQRNWRIGAVPPPVTQTGCSLT